MKRATILLLAPLLAWAATGAAFLKIPVDARVCAIGEAGTGWIDNSAALYYNPAGLSRVRGFDVLLMHNDWLLDMAHEYGAAAWGAGGLGGFGVSFDYWTSGELQGINHRGETIPGYVFSATDWSLALGYGRGIGPLDAGIALKFVSQRQDSFGASAWAGDLGLMYQTPLEGLELGAGVANIGTRPKLVTEDCGLPWTARVGWRYSRWGFGLSQDFIVTETEQPGIAAGLEYDVLGIVGLRVGYRTGSDPGGLAHLRAGLGVKWRGLEVDYAFAPYGALGMTHRLSLNLASSGFVEKETDY